MIELGNPKHHEAFSYPGGERQIRLSPGTYNWLNSIHNKNNEITVLARIKTSQDLVDLILLKNAIDSATPFPYPMQLWLPYLPYGRADRKFTDGDCFGLQAFARIINSLGFHSVASLDTHNKAMTKAWIRNFADVDPYTYIKKAIIDFAERMETVRVNVLFPDEGAANRYKVLEDLSGNNRAVLTKSYFATKERDEVTGKLIGFTVPDMPYNPTIIIDDICDGGGTFLGIRKLLKQPGYGLYTTHGIYSNGTTALTEAFDWVYCTNSFIPIQIHPRNFTQFTLNFGAPTL